MARPTNLERILDKKYMGKSISQTIKNTEVDQQKLRESPLSQAEVDIVKKKYNIRTFSSREEFNFQYADDARRTIIQDMRIANARAKERGEKEPYQFRNANTKDNYVDAQVTQRLNEYYSYYQHRELLILTGQYDEIRAKMYKEQYLSHLESGNMPKELIRNIRELSLEEWKKLVEQPDPTTDSIKLRALPALSNIYSYESKGSNAQNIVAEIKEAFSSSGLEYKSYPDEDRKDVYRKRFAKLADAYYEGRLRITDKGNGNYAIPTIGSTDGKNADIAKEFIDYLNEHSEDYQ